MLLTCRNPPVRIEDDDPYAGLTVKSRGNGTTSVTGGGNQDRGRAPGVRRARHYPGHAGGEETRTEILEGCGGTVEELQ